jgi:hypothetical protein
MRSAMIRTFVTAALCSAVVGAQDAMPSADAVLRPLQHLDYFGPLKTWPPRPNGGGVRRGSSLASQRVHRMHVRRAACRYPAGAQRHDQQQTCRARQRDQIR